MLCLSEAILIETAAVLLRPKHRRGRGYDPTLVTHFCGDLLVVAELAVDLPALRAVPSDPKDDMVVATAVAARAGYLVTGDRRHLLPLGSFQGVRIVGPRAFLELLPA